jgi:hypothetical protein
MTVITIFLILIFLELVGLMVGGFLAWQKISIYLTWNISYEGREYEAAITAPKLRKPPAKASKTEQKGRTIQPVDDLVDLADLNFDNKDAISAIEEMGK